jgi:hypothetical protein
VITDETGSLVDFGDVTGISAETIAALQRPWNETAILARARHFSYLPFKDRLSDLLA